MTLRPVGHPHDDLAVHAVDGLERAERARVEAHLDGCPGCRRRLAAHHQALALLVPDEPAPPGLWDAIVADLHPRPLARPTPLLRPCPTPRRPPPPPSPLTRRLAGGPATLDSAGPVPLGPAGRGRPQPRPRRAPASVGPAGRRARRWLAAAAGMAAALVALAGLVGARSATPEGRPDDGSLAAARQAVAAAGAEATSMVAPDGRVVARVAPDGADAWMLAEGLAPLPEGRAYQLWRLQGEGAKSLGLLGAGGAEVAMAVEGLASGSPDGAMLAISDEPIGGSKAPSGPIVATGALVG